MTAFIYPATPHQRKHGPRGYVDYSSFRPWLRDEFSFSCIYCLIREQWGRVTGDFDIDHFIPQATDPNLTTDYDNLVLSCARCNQVKLSQHVPDPLTALTVHHLQIQPDGSLECYSREAESLVLKLDLNSPEMISWRLLWIRIIELARENDTDLLNQLMGFPTNLPNLGRLRPPGGNSRPEGIANCYFSQSERGELPAVF
ncbi:MAG: hypothetical protein JWM11_184 [Planctomycetaceae bacterium]|nr:hypothetical protein [Planctomycetaceae bacterium]